MPIKVLGPIEITDGRGNPVATLSNRQRRLLAALSVDSGSFVSAERLVHRVWGDDELPDGGVRALHTRISRLRPHLAAVGVEIVTEGHAYSLQVDGDLDASRFEELVDAGRKAVAQGDRPVAASRLEEAFGLWRGEAYQDVAGLDWAQVEIARLEEIRTAALEHRFAVLLDEGRHTQIVPTVEEAVVESPWRDRLRGQLALALYRSGRQTEALRSLARYRKELAEELGLEPGPEIRELEAKILAQDPGLALAEPVRDVAGYQFHEVVGEGAFAVVWRATQPALGRQVAVKQIRAQLANRPEFIRRFEAEAQLVASLEHPYVVPLYDYWREPDGAFLVMRWLRGGTLSSRLINGPLSPDALARLIGQVAAVLRTAHEAGMIHRDVKSSNVLFDEEGHAFLGDFGIAFAGRDGDAFAEAMSTGSPAYASPEQLRRENLDARSDLYALGIVIFEAATGRLPFVATSQAGLVRAQLEDPVPAPSTVADAVPAWVDAVVAGCCAKDRDDRFADVHELLVVVPHGPEDPLTDTGLALSSFGPPRRGPVDVGNPYKGLRAFSETDSADFCGRDRLIDRFLAVLARPGVAGRLLVAVGASGSGKSSAVRAGLIPALRHGELAGSERWLVTTMMPGKRPFEELESALLRIAPAQPGPLVELMSSDERGITRAFRRTAPEEDAEVVLVIDQFEELFTLTDTDRRNRFLAGLIEVLCEPRTRVRVVATIRADFWDRPLRHPAFASMLEHAVVSVGPMTAAELERAIVEPARSHGVGFAPGLIARMIADVSDQPGALPLLQYTLTALFEAQVDGVIGLDAYDDVGGIDGALAKRAERIHDDADASVRAAMRHVLGDLVTLGEGIPDTRRRVRLAQLRGDDESRTAVELLGTARLLTYDHDPATREPTVEIAHEALLRAWPRLRRWIDEDRDELRAHRQLSAAATDWDSNDRDPDLLYRGARLDDALELEKTADERVDAVETEFLTAGSVRARADARRSRRRTRVLQGLLAFAAVLMVIAVVAGLVAVGQRDDARTARVAAEVDRMAAQAPASAASDPRLALLMAAEAHARADSAESLGSLQRTLLATGPILGYVGDPDHQYRDVHWIDEATIVAVHLGGVEIYDLQTGTRTFEHAVEVPERRGTRAVDAGGVVSFDASPDGTLLAVGTVAGDVDLIDVTTGGSRTLRHGSRVGAVAFHPDGSQIATGDAEGVVRIFDPNSGQLALDFVAHSETASDFQELVDPLGMFDANGGPDAAATVGRGVHVVEYLPDGSLITATVPVVRHWDSSTGQQLGADMFPPGDASQFPVNSPPIMITTLIDDVRVDPRDPGALAVASRNYVQVVGLDDGIQRSQIWLPTDRLDTNTTIAGSTFTSAGTWILWLSDGRIRTLDEQGIPQLTVRPALRTPAALELAPSGTRLAGAADGGVVIMSLTGQTLLAETVPKDLPGQFSTISPDGALITENAWATGPTTFHGRSGTGWAPTTVPREIGEFAAGVPTDVAGEPLVQVFRTRGDPEELTPEAVNATFETAWINLETGADRFVFQGAVFAHAVSPDQNMLALHAGLEISVWDMRTRTQIVALDDLQTQQPPRSPVIGGTQPRSIDFSHDGRRLVATGQDGRIAMWDTETWAPVDLPNDVGPAVVAGFSRNGRFFATAQSNGAITLYDPETLNELRVIRGLGIPDLTGGWFEWSADGRHLLTLVDGVPRLWDLESGTQIGDEFPLGLASRPGAASGSELQLVTTQGDLLNVWNLDTDSWAPIACRAAGRNMTRAEWESFGPADEPYRATCPQFTAGE